MIQADSENTSFKVQRTKMKREAEKAKKEANNRARKSSHDTIKEDKAIADKVRLDFHFFPFKYTAKIRTFLPYLYMSSKYN